MSGPRTAQDRLRRLLIMLPWLMERGEVPLAEVAQRFDMSESDVVDDLERVAMCGLPPYVDEMVDVFVDDGLVFVGVPRLFTRSLRLTAPEGFSLLAAGRAALELPGVDPDGPLARGLAKLADSLGRAGIDVGDGDTAGLAVDLDRPAMTDTVVDAVAEGTELEIEYYSPSRGESTRRVVVPRHVFVDAGKWYVVADDVGVGERRTFRIDRIEALAETGVSHEVDRDVRAPEGFFVDAELPRATLRVKPAGQWIVDRYPTDSVTPVGKRSRDVVAVLPVASEWWLSRLLVRLGPDAVVVEPEASTASGKALAQRILANY